MPSHPVVTREEWTTRRKALLEKEKAHTRARDALNAERRALPWVRMEKGYVFDTRNGPQDLAGLFDGRDQLILYHFMLAPGWAAGCEGCSFLADHFDGALPHLHAGGVTLAAVSSAPLPEIEAYRSRMGWRFPWASSAGSDFNFDFGVSSTPESRAHGKALYNYAPMTGEFDELHGVSVFARQDGEVFHTYSTYARGIEEALGAFMLMDRVPKGRNEEGTMNWVRRHDEYAGATAPTSCCHG
jgi:predicted dithiol-disulfide oxidoreductase (DUF899 family)